MLESYLLKSVDTSKSLMVNKMTFLTKNLEAGESLDVALVVILPLLMDIVRWLTADFA